MPPGPLSFRPAQGVMLRRTKQTQLDGRPIIDLPPRIQELVKAGGRAGQGSVACDCAARQACSAAGCSPAPLALHCCALCTAQLPQAPPPRPSLPPCPQR